MKYPIGIQTFEKLREGGFVYVDKTALIYKLAQDGGCVFLSRPRRFGKSLLISTLRSYFEGDSTVFRGTDMERLETVWRQHPVLHIDFNTIERGRKESFDERMEAILGRLEKRWGVTKIATAYPIRLENIIHAAYEATGEQVVVLIDEYDKPILVSLEHYEDSAAVREKLKAFYSVLKGEDRYLRFAMLTGVTRFSKVSVFSDLNNLKDISLDRRYATLCGVTDEELRTVFKDEVAALADDNGMTVAECYAELRRQYDGYHFAYKAPGVYNPFSLFNALDKRTFDAYWFATGTPSFLLTVMRRTQFDFTTGFDKPVPAAELSNVDSIDRSPLPILFQSGYLTITDYDKDFREYTLGYPNAEVREGFIDYLLRYYSAAGDESSSSATNLVRSIKRGDCASIVASLKLLFDKGGNCMLYEEKSRERDFRNIVYMVFRFLDIHTEAEFSTSAGRMDICCQTKDIVYIMELKMDQAADKAIAQIHTHGYTKRFLSDPRRLLLLGLNFSSATNSIEEWRWEEVRRQNTAEQ